MSSILSNSTTASTDRNFTINNGSSGTIEVTSAGTMVTWSGGSASSTGVLNKTGLGQLNLTGTNLHTGGTNVNAGTLLVNGSLSTGAVSVANLATLGGTGTIGGTVTPASGGIIAPGDSTTLSGVGTLTVAGLTLGNGSITNFEFGTGNDQITVNGAGGTDCQRRQHQCLQRGHTNGVRHQRNLQLIQYQWWVLAAH